MFLNSNASKATAQLLQAILADLIDLSLQVKVAHWNVQGSHFRSAHLQFDEIVEICREELDEIAERIRAIGGTVLGGLAPVQRLSGLAPIPEGQFDVSSGVSVVYDRIVSLTGRARDALQQLGELDAISEDLVIGTIGRLEKAGWMLVAQIPDTSAK